MDTHSILQKVSIVDLIEEDLGRWQKRSGRWLFWSCPFHADKNTPSLAVTPDNGRYHCFGCGKNGDSITWLMDYHGLSFRAACRRLEQTRVSPRMKRVTSPYMSEPENGIGEGTPDTLQGAWRQVVTECARLLWQPVGAKARDYLAARGLRGATLQHPFWQVGYSPGMRIGKVWIERGIVLPCLTIGQDKVIEYIDYITVRRPVGLPKYRKLPGHGTTLSGLYGASGLPGKANVVMVEGEFDALLLWQEAGHLVGVATPGSASNRFNFGRFGKFLLSAQHIFIAYDQDEAGLAARQYWQGLSQRVRAVNIPVGNDITEYYLAGGNLAMWVERFIYESGTRNRLLSSGRNC